MFRNTGILISSFQALEYWPYLCKNWKSDFHPCKPLNSSPILYTYWNSDAIIINFGINSMRWRPNPWPNGNCLTSWLPKLSTQDGLTINSGWFQLRPCRAHNPALSLRCVSWGDGPGTPTLEIFLLCTRNIKLKRAEQNRDNLCLAINDTIRIPVMFITIF